MVPTKIIQGTLTEVHPIIIVGTKTVILLKLVF